MHLYQIEALIFAGALISAAIFAFLETAFTALRLFKLKELAKKMTHYKWLFEAWEKTPQRILITILIASNLAHVTASVAITDVIQHFLGNTGLALLFGIGIATVMILVIGEIIPKSYAKTHAESMIGSSLWLINALYFIFYPVVTVLTRFSTWTVAVFGGETQVRKSDVVSEKELEFLIGYSDKAGIIEAEKSEMLQNIFTLGQTLAKEVMVPATDMVCIDVEESLGDAMALFSKHRYTRMPVYEDKEDNIIGLIHQKDIFELLYRKEEKPLRELVLPIMQVPESKKTNQLLHEFLEKRIHMAILIDEYGAVMGLVSLEDVIEEIVGEIRDEHEHDHADIVKLEQGGFVMQGNVALEEAQDALGIKFRVEDSVTLAGFLAEKLQHLPKKGERVYYEGYCFQIQRASERRVQQVLVFKE